jgi:hypothetical protein
MLQCFMTMLDKGLVMGGGIGDYTEPIHYNKDIGKYYVKLANDQMFFVFVKIILMNILFGIIIDTFASLRLQNRAIEVDKQNFCFICNFDRFELDKNAEGGFDRHISQDHYLWAYVFYIVHLECKDDTDYTGIESFVSEQYENGDISWVPRQKALCMQHVTQDDEEEDSELSSMKKEFVSATDRITRINERLNKLHALAAKKTKDNGNE